MNLEIQKVYYKNINYVHVQTHQLNLDKFRIISHRNVITSSDIWAFKQNLNKNDYHAHWATNHSIFYKSANVKHIDS